MATGQSQMVQMERTCYWKNAIILFKQYAYTTGKNATDSANDH